MSDLEQSIKLPKRNELYRRLVDVNKVKDVRRGLYPYFLEYAGMEREPIEVAMLIIMGIFKYEKMDSKATMRFVRLYSNGYIEAMIDDLGMIEKVKRLLEESLFKN